MSCSRRWMTREARNLCLFFQRANYRLRNGLSGGYAHTYMAAEYLEKAGRKLGVKFTLKNKALTALKGV